MEDFFLTIVLGFFLFIIGIIFLRSPYKDKTNVLSLWITDGRKIKYSNQIVCIFEFFMGSLLLLNCIVSIAIVVPNYGAIPFFIGFFGAWPLKILILLSSNKKNYNELPRPWPFKKA